MNKKWYYYYFFALITFMYSAPIYTDFNDRKIIEISSVEQFNNYINNHNAVFVYFSAPWCGACTKAKPIIDKIAAKKELAPIYFLYINTDHNAQLAKMYNINGVPTFCYFSHGALKAQETGVKSLDTFENHIIVQLKKQFTPLLNQVDIVDPEIITETVEVEVPEEPTIVDEEDDEEMFDEPMTGPTNNAEENNIIVKISAFFSSIFMKIKDAIMSFINYIRSFFMRT